MAHTDTIPLNTNNGSRLCSMRHPKSKAQGKKVIFNVGPEGGHFTIPRLGIEMLISRDALVHWTELTMCVKDRLEDFPEPLYDWHFLSPCVQIEPEDIKYERPVYLIFNHGIQMDRSLDKGHCVPVLLHRAKHGDGWNVICSSSKEAVTVSDAQMPHGLPVCFTKQAIITSNAVIVSMQSNCQYCLCWKQDAIAVKRLVMRMSLLVYADYQQASQALNVRVHAVHDVNDRKYHVERSECGRFGGHFVGETMVFIDQENCPLKIDVTVTVDGNELPNIQDSISYDRLMVELDQMNGDPPYRSFIIKLGSTPTSVRMFVASRHHDLLDRSTDSRVLDVVRLVSHPGAVSSVIDIDMEYPDPDVAPVYISPLDTRRNRIYQFLDEKLTDNDIRLIQSHWEAQEIGHNQGNLSSMRRILLDLLVGTADVQTVQTMLDRLGIRIDLSSFLNNPSRGNWRKLGHRV